MDISIDTIQQWLATYGLKVLAAIVIFILGRWLSKRLAKLFSRLLEHNKVEITLIKFLQNIVYYALLTAVIIAALNQLGINTTSFLTVIGAAGLAIGLALKDSLSNFSAGVMLIFFRPFKVGDFVTAGGVSGTVKEISIFNTEMATPDNQKVIVPNSSIMGGVITNVTANSTRRIDMVVGISYDDDMKKAKEVIAAVIGSEPRVLKDPPPTIAVAEMADSSINLVVRPWVNTSEYWPTRFDLTERIKEALDAADITIPYPQQDVHLFVAKEQTEQVLSAQS